MVKCLLVCGRETGIIAPSDPRKYVGCNTFWNYSDCLCSRKSRDL